MLPNQLLVEVLLLLLDGLREIAQSRALLRLAKSLGAQQSDSQLQWCMPGQ
jgi:hypothetical protein